MDFPQPRFTVIVPMARFRPDEPALVSLREMPKPEGGVQIIVPEGVHPARQRNVAVGRALGEIVVFLDNDCTLGTNYWSELTAGFARPEVRILGGPARLRVNAGNWEHIFHALLTHVLIVGSVSSRYTPRGQFREAHQTDLILCNLAVRRATFAEIGPLSNDLYPNEENEWLDRAHAAGVGAYYDPELQVFRPQRTTPGSMVLTLLRYGMGRTRQFRVSGWRVTFHQFLPLVLVATVAALVYGQLWGEFLVLWLLASIIVAVTCDKRLSLWQRGIAGLIGPLVPMTYSIGQILGWIALCFPVSVASTEIVLLNEKGEKI
jgi:GT2 family glycosyltransferase